MWISKCFFFLPFSSRADHCVTPIHSPQRTVSIGHLVLAVVAWRLEMVLIVMDIAEKSIGLKLIKELITGVQEGEEAGSPPVNSGNFASCG